MVSSFRVLHVSKVIDDAQAQVPADNTGVRLYAAYPYDKGPSVFDATHNWRVNVLYHFRDIKSDNFAQTFARLVDGKHHCVTDGISLFSK